MDIKTSVDRCVHDLALADKTKNSYRYGLLKFLEYLDDEHGISKDAPIESLTIDHFIYFLPWLDESYAKQTTSVWGSASRALLDWMVTAGIIEISYKDALRYKTALRKSHKRKESRLPRWPKNGEVERLIDAARNSEERSPIKERNIALIEFFICTGCRNNEVVTLTVDDINMQKRTTVVTGKGSKQRAVFFNKTTSDAILEYWKVRGSAKKDDPVFARHDKKAGHGKLKPMSTDTPRNVVKGLMEVAGIERLKFSPHYFRHAFAIKMLRETGNIALVQDLLGHEDPKSTRVYAKIDAEDLKKSYHDVFGK